MKVFQHQRAVVAVMAASGLLALAACTPAGTGTSAPASSLTAAAPSPTESAVTAPPSPAAQPGAAATVGAVVAGFPQDLLPLMPGATVEQSSFDKTAVPARAALVGSIASPPPAVLAYYTAELEARGFKAVPGETAGSVLSKDFLRGDSARGIETADISITEKAGRSTFSIGAHVAAESVK